MKVELKEYPHELDWVRCKDRALVTVGKHNTASPTPAWREKILTARHSPIRCLHFSFYIECPYWVSVHLCRHVHAQPYIRSQRNDRQFMYDRNKAPQGETISMIWDMNAEELITIANKRLCKKASQETRDVVRAMCDAVINKCPEFKNQLVPMCVRENACHEMQSCGRESIWPN